MRAAALQGWMHLVAAPGSHGRTSPAPAGASECVCSLTWPWGTTVEAERGPQDADAVGSKPGHM